MSLIRLIYINNILVDFMDLENLLKLFEHSEMYVEEIRKIKLRWWFLHKSLRQGEETSILLDIFRTIVSGRDSLDLAKYGNKLLKLKGDDFKYYIIKKHKKLFNKN